jgi:hypothetical protein
VAHAVRAADSATLSIAALLPRARAVERVRGDLEFRDTQQVVNAPNGADQCGQRAFAHAGGAGKAVVSVVGAPKSWGSVPLREVQDAALAVAV